jgi:hypothetical protein
MGLRWSGRSKGSDLVFQERIFSREARGRFLLKCLGLIKKRNGMSVGNKPGSGEYSSGFPCALGTSTYTIWVICE